MGYMKEVELVSTGVFLPGDPVPFEKIEEVIGHLDQASPRMKKMIKKLRPSVKELIGIDQCYFAVDPATKTITESNTSMTVKAVHTALKKAGLEPEDIDCLMIATPVPEQQTPPITTLVQHQLGIESCGEIEVHSNCTGLTKVFQIAYDALRLGRYKNVVVAYTQLSSPYLISSYYNQERVGREHLLLRWFLSDSASAAVLRAHDKLESGIKLQGVYNESLGGKLPPSMWLALGAANLDLPAVYEKGLHHLGQDYNAVVGEAGEFAFIKGFGNMLRDLKIDADAINYLLATVPSTLLLNKIKKHYLKEFLISYEKWYSNIRTKGYSGGSSVLIGLDEMLEKQIFKKNDLLVSFTIESSKWMVGGFALNNLGE
jgi:3-oxoacyl-[acyl-carrier-protein] synthase III